MATDQYNIRKNIAIGKQVFERLPNDIRPGWSGLILSCFDRYLPSIPTCIIELYAIIDDKGHWKDAHNQFNLIRNFLLQNKAYQPEAYLLLAELVAKVTYNASGRPAPFDSDSGHYIASVALRVAEHFNDAMLDEEVISVILLFSHNRTFNGLKAAKDFITYKGIADILWFDWDPIGINGLAPRDEYQSYVPQIFELVITKSDRQDIAHRLYKLETENMSMNGSIDHCLVIADKILSLQ